MVTARAVANLSKLVRLTAPLLRPGGALLALKGMRAQDEVDDAKYVIKKAKLSVAVVHEVVTAGDETTAVVEIRRPEEPLRYGARFGVTRKDRPARVDS